MLNCIVDILLGIACIIIGGTMLTEMVLNGITFTMSEEAIFKSIAIAIIVIGIAVIVMSGYILIF